MMDFREASEIARKTPGAILTRDGLGTFVVRLPDGALITGVPAEHLLPHDLYKVQTDHSQEIAKLQKEFSVSQERLLWEVAELSKISEDYKSRIAKARSQVVEKEEEIATLRNELEKLKVKISKVSDTEWQRIKELDRVEREAEAERKRAERRNMKCTCDGQVENCAKCYGSGEYSVDGYGNLV